ncbi:MAG: hypothetical protein ACRDTF_17930 [Pseudonocardiaceae bacterium]
MTETQVHRFDADTRVRAVEDARWSAEIGSGWNAIGGQPNGGYLLAAYSDRTMLGWPIEFSAEPPEIPGPLPDPGAARRNPRGGRRAVGFAGPVGGHVQAARAGTSGELIREMKVNALTVVPRAVSG